jgi:hypothetical protein
MPWRAEFGEWCNRNACIALPNPQTEAATNRGRDLRGFGSRETLRFTAPAAPSSNLLSFNGLVRGSGQAPAIVLTFRTARAPPSHQADPPPSFYRQTWLKRGRPFSRHRPTFALDAVRVYSRAQSAPRAAQMIDRPKNQEDAAIFSAQSLRDPIKAVVDDDTPPLVTAVRAVLASFTLARTSNDPTRLP